MFICSTGENISPVFEGSILTSEMQAEEEKLEEANSKEEEKIRQQLEDRARQENELKEKRYPTIPYVSHFQWQTILVDVSHATNISRSTTS